MNSAPTKILVVDDSALYRQSIQNVLRDVADASIVGTAQNGVEALEKIERLDPDLLTLDVQMPDMDGIQLLREMKRRGFRSGAIMVSSLTSAGAQVTTDALLEGAFDFILKPSSNDCDANRQQLKEALEEKISAFRESAGRRIRGSCRPVASRTLASRALASGTLVSGTLVSGTVAADDVVESAPAPINACQVVIVGTSTGGPEALKAVLPRLPAEIPVPLLVVQHMPAQYTRSLALRLDEICELEVVEAQDKTEAVAGKIIIAQGGQQMQLKRVGGSLLVRVNDDPPENGVRPSVDYLLRSVCNVFHGDALAVIMTGMGRDGLEGCLALKQAGGFVFAQCQDDCVVYGMPKAIIEKGLSDRILPLGKIAPAIVRHLKRSRRS